MAFDEFTKSQRQTSAPADPDPIADGPAKIQSTVPGALPTNPPAKIEASLSQAHQLYETVQNLVKSANPTDVHTARLIVETCDDAISEFGNTNQDKKLDLRKWKAEAEQILPPATLKDLKDRAEALVLAKGYPKSNRIRNILLYAIGAIILIGTLIGIYSMFARPGTKAPSEEKSSSNISKPPDSISINLPDGLTLRTAIKFLAQIDNFTADFKPNCTNQFLDTEIEGGPLTGASTIEVIEILRLRLKNSDHTLNYRVEKKPEKGIYEISCS